MAKLDEGFKATEEFVAAAGKVRGLIADGRVARSEVEQVRVAARRALGDAAAALGRDRVAKAAEEAEGRATEQMFRAQLKRLRDRCSALAVATDHPAQQYAQQAIAQARLDAVVETAELVLGYDAYRRVLRELGLASHYLR